MFLVAVVGLWALAGMAAAVWLTIMGMPLTRVLFEVFQAALWSLPLFGGAAIVTSYFWRWPEDEA